MIDVRGLTKRYGTLRVLDDVSFTVPQGHIVGFLGQNGAGKTTTMRILTGYIPPTSGTAAIAGFDVVTESLDVRRHIGYVPETAPLYPDMTAEGYLAYIASLRGVRHTKEAVEHTLERVGLTSWRQKLIRELSKGMRQRLGLAQAMVHDPPVLILDEPTIGLDPQQARELRAFIGSLSGDHTILFSTHILSEAEQLCDEVVIIHTGRVLAQGPPSWLGGQLQSGGVFVHVAQNQSQLTEVLGGLSSVESVVFFGEGVVVRGKDDQDIRSQIAEAVSGFGLLELRPLATSLEEFFFEVTKDA